MRDSTKRLRKQREVAVDGETERSGMSEKSLGGHPKVSPEEMEKRIFRFKDIEGKGSRATGTLDDTQTWEGA